MSSLPPPPPEPVGSWSGGWDPTPPPVPTHPVGDLSDRPTWRQGRPGWALAHLAIATGLMIAGLFAIGVVLAVTGRTESDIDLAAEERTGTAMLLLWAGCLVGWFLFAYMRGSPTRRWAAFGGVAGGAWFLALVLILAATD